MFLGRLSLDFIIHECCYIVLKRFSEHIYSGEVGSFLDLLLQSHIGLKNLHVAICQVILTSHGIAHRYWRSDWRRSNSQVLDDHIFWPWYFGVEAHQSARICINSLKNLVSLIWLQELLPVPPSFLLIFGILNLNLESSLREFRLLVKALFALLHSITEFESLCQLGTRRLDSFNFLKFFFVC